MTSERNRDGRPIPSEERALSSLVIVFGATTAVLAIGTVALGFYAKFRDPSSAGAMIGPGVGALVALLVWGLTWSILRMWRQSDRESSMSGWTDGHPLAVGEKGTAVAAARRRMRHRGDPEALEGVDEPVMLIVHDEYSENLRRIAGQKASSSTSMSNELPALLEAARAANAGVFTRLDALHSPE